MWCVVNATPRQFYPPGKTRDPLYRRLGGPLGRSGLVRKISPYRDSIPGPSSPERVTIPTELCNMSVLFQRDSGQTLVESSSYVMAHGDAREGK